jgi:hypothetical protein
VGWEEGGGDGDGEQEVVEEPESVWIVAAVPYVELVLGVIGEAMLARIVRV